MPSDAPADHDAPADVFAVPGPLAAPAGPVRRSSAAEEARTIVAGTTTATLGSLSEDGGPWASMVAVASLRDGRPVLVVSTLAEHGRNLLRDNRASLSVVAPARGDDPLDSGRVSLAGRVEQAEGADAEEAREAYQLAVPPAGLFSGFGDFRTWVLRVERIRWVGGYGRMDHVTVPDYEAAEPDPVVPGSAAAIGHLNADHADALLDMARHLAGFTDAESAECVRADRYGLDLAVRTPRGATTARVGYDERLDAPAGLRAATVALTKKARGGALALLVTLASVAGLGAGPLAGDAQAWSGTEPAPLTTPTAFATPGAASAATTLAAPGAWDSGATPAAPAASTPGTSTLKAAASTKAAKRTTAPKRVVTLSPFLSNATSRLGVKPIAMAQAGSYIKPVAGLKGVRQLKMGHPDGPNIETLIRLRPDLVLSSPNWRTGTPKIQEQKIPVVDGYDPLRVNTVSPAVRLIAAKLGKSKQTAARLTKRIDDGIRKARAGIKVRPKVLVVLGVGRNTIAFLPNSWGGDLVGYAGGQLVTSGLKATFDAGTPGSFAPLSDEEVLRRNPDVIIVVPHGAASSIPSTIEFFKNKPGWAPTAAAKNGRIYIADPERLLQSSDDPGAMITWVRKTFLRN
ncbi:ABC transporter substrate-binding protein [Patulibacter sp. NPDC049589]|uniref:ABC transporter substrate-binding protein n=1 Tax=Patulibacter sp. NPDC049589 TaxID=3154731 RepID=UPI003430F61F